MPRVDLEQEPQRRLDVAERHREHTEADDQYDQDRHQDLAGFLDAA